MTSRKILHVMLATSVALGTTAIGSAVYASPGHDDEKPAAKQQDKKAKTQKKSKAGTKAEVSGAMGTIDEPRDIAITMTDTLRFDPGTIVVAEGETVRFLLDNPTVAPHDFLIGDLEEQEHHHQEMATGEGHDESPEPEGEFPAPVTLEPGESAEVIATFGEVGQLLIGCHVPGHWEAGMRGTVAVVPTDLTLGTLDAPRDVAITMTDTLRFDPGTVVVAEGETIRFLLDNPTVAPHDFLVGDLEEQLHHHEEMAAGEGHDDEAADEEGGFPPAVTLEPGESAEVLVTFTEAGELLIGCHVPGHWEAGMRGTVSVAPAERFPMA